MTSYQDWIGREETAHDVLTPAALARLWATLDRVPPADVTAPPLAHWLCFLPATRGSDIDVDGHPKRGGFLPPIALPRRMWAGGRLTFHASLPIGVPLTRRSTIADLREKSGASGPLVFVTVRHEVLADGAPIVTEEQDLVYREAPRQGAASPAPPAWAERGAIERETAADAVTLFRFSALTFNGHRIHYDRDYAQGAEGYPGLVVHGPLLATLLVNHWLEANPGRTPERFAFRAERPVFDGDRFALCLANDGARLWVRGADGARAMSGEIG